MPTENPKVSAYVPQAIKDRLIQFREERNISESQAVTIILAEYFEMTEVLGRFSGEAGGVTLAGMEAIESKLASFVEQVESRLTALENTTQNKSELLVEPSTETKLQDQDVSEIPLNLLGEPLQKISPIPGIKLSKLRFGRPEAAIAGIKRSKSVEELTEWTRKYDPDGIAWKFVESPMKGYVPVEELSSELKSKLLSWIKENIS